MAPKQKKNNRNKTTEVKEGVETMGSDLVNEEVKEESAVEEVVEDNTKDEEAVEPEPEQEVEVDEFEEFPPVGDDADLIELRACMKEYLDGIRDPNSPAFTQKNTMLFIKACKVVIRKDKVKLIKYFFEGLIQAHAGDLIKSETVLIYMNKINDADKTKVETLYTALMALDNYFKRPKKIGYPLDTETIKKNFGGDSLSNFIKTRVN